MWIANAWIVNEGRVFEGSVKIEGERIVRVVEGGARGGGQILDARESYLLPGLIDDQVHFREPGLTHKADLHSESRAAVAGGVTSFMEMPNTFPPAVTIELLERKYERAAQVSLANYSFYLGATNDNREQWIRLDARRVCGLKVFMGSSTGELLVDDDAALENIFAESPVLVATHCEDEPTVRANTHEFRRRHPDGGHARLHPLVRSREACFASSSKAVALARKYGTRLHVLHLSTAEETALFDPAPLKDRPDKRITAEACWHHLWFCDRDYERLGNRIKWNPAIKTAEDRSALRRAVAEGRIDVLASDHAPHTVEEKNLPYFDAPSGGPWVQHAVPMLFELVEAGAFDLPTAVERAAHAPARLFAVKDRGFVREGCYADLVLVRPRSPYAVVAEDLLYKCRWSPLEGQKLSARVECVWVNGAMAYRQGVLNEGVRGKRLIFER
ncbi:MAG: dihydroorotase [Bacteroidia bacterium]|nr:dihydroorotase [Bacteroidia bacterium]